jgi:hypothetical protein
MSALNCTSGADPSFILLTTHARYKEIYATMLSWMLSWMLAGRVMTVRVQEETEGCAIMYVMVS